MRTSFLSLAAFLVVLSSCGPSEAEMKAAREKAIADSLATIAAMERSFSIDAANSSVKWTGTMLGVKSHFGQVRLAEGKLTVKGPSIVGGSFVVDMSSITAQDSAYAPDDAKQGTRAMLLGHLASPDFFDVANHPQATFEITSVEADALVGNLTIRGVTNQEKVTGVTMSVDGDNVKASGKLTFDRQKYGVAWSSGAKDMVLSDNIDVEISLTGQAAAATI